MAILSLGNQIDRLLSNSVALLATGRWSLSAPTVLRLYPHVLAVNRAHHHHAYNGLNMIWVEVELLKDL